MSPDSVTSFYDQHPYPPPVSDLSEYATRWADGALRRVEHHRMWPAAPMREDVTVLVAGCGTSQAARYALRYPAGRVVGIDVSETGIAHNRGLAEQHGLQNLELHRLGITDVAELETSFDHIVCTGVLHHMDEPGQGLEALSEVLATDGAMHLMLYATYGRTGVYMIQDYCRRLGIGTDPAEIEDLVATLREIPAGHPLSHLLRATPDFRDPDALADALLHPRDRAYTVPQVFELLRGAGLRFGRWVRQAPYLPSCGSVAETPHGERIQALPAEARFAALELFRGTMTRHSLIAYGDGSSPSLRRLTFSPPRCEQYVPVLPSTVVAVEERLPDGAAAALLNRAHEFTDLVLFVDPAEKRAFDAIDGSRTIGEIGVEHAPFFERLHEHDLVVIDASES